jgi:flagellar hook-associated protein FlgK
VRNYTESGTSQITAAQDVHKIGEKKEGEKAINEEKLEKAKALMNEAKEMAKKESEEAKKAVKEKMAEISKIIQFLPGWNKQDIGLKPDELLQKVDEYIDQLSSMVEVGESYKSDLEVVRKASGGRALCGIYHSEYVPPITAELPIIAMPSELILTSPNNSQQVRYVKFSKSRAATNYVHAVKSSSSNIGLSVGGFYDLFVGNISGSYDSRSDEGITTCIYV